MTELAARLLADPYLRTRRRGAAVLVGAASWLAAVNLAEDAGARVLGLEGFVTDGAHVRVDDEFIADFDDPSLDASLAAARRVLSAWLAVDDCPDWVEFVTD